MVQTIHCPSCRQKLQLPEEYLGKSVQCPECKQSFTAVADQVASGPPPVPKDGPTPEKKPRAREVDDEDDDDRPRKKRKRPSTGSNTYFDALTQRYRKKEPHRGILMLVMGVLSFLVCPPILGPTAYYMATMDLSEINDGRMDSAGRGMTQTGRILGAISTGLCVFLVVACCCAGIIKLGTTER